MKKTPTLTDQLNKIGKDILMHLANSKEALTEDELYKRSNLSPEKTGAGLSRFGWGFALDKLERSHEIEFVDPQHWRLKNPERKAYLNNVNELTNTKVRPD
jgi:hypothetical protein